MTFEDPLRRVEALMTLVTGAHVTIFNWHRQVVDLERADDHTRDLVRESAQIAAVKAPETVRLARTAVLDMELVRLLEPAADEDDSAIPATIAAAEATLLEVLRRQEAIAGELAARVRW